VNQKAAGNRGFFAFGPGMTDHPADWFFLSDLRT